MAQAPLYKTKNTLEKVSVVVDSMKEIIECHNVSIAIYRVERQLPIRLFFGV